MTQEKYGISIEGIVYAQEGKKVGHYEFLHEFHAFLNKRGWRFDGDIHQVNPDGESVESLDKPEDYKRGPYGGKPTVMHTLPVGSVFHVCNGCWDGEIIEKEGIKYIKVLGSGDEDQDIPIEGKHVGYTLDIEMLERKPT